MRGQWPHTTRCRKASPCSIRRQFSAAMLKERAKVPLESQAICGASTTLGRPSKGSAGSSGSAANTSSPAAAKWPDCSAATSAAWSTNPPRAVFTGTAPSFMCAIAALWIRRRFSCVSGIRRDTTLASAQSAPNGQKLPITLGFGVRAVHKTSYPMACKTGVSSFCAAGQGGLGLAAPSAGLGIEIGNMAKRQTIHSKVSNQTKITKFSTALWQLLLASLSGKNSRCECGGNPRKHHAWVASQITEFLISGRVDGRQIVLPLPVR